MILRIFHVLTFHWSIKKLLYLQIYFEKIRLSENYDFLEYCKHFFRRVFIWLIFRKIWIGWLWERKRKLIHYPCWRVEILDRTEFRSAVFRSRRRAEKFGRFGVLLHVWTKRSRKWKLLRSMSTIKQCYTSASANLMSKCVREIRTIAV